MSESLTKDLRFPRQTPRRDGDWIIDVTFLRQVKLAHDAVPEHYDIDLEQIEEVLIALEKVLSNG